MRMLRPAKTRRRSAPPVIAKPTINIRVECVGTFESFDRVIALLGAELTSRDHRLH